MDIKISEQDN